MSSYIQVNIYNQSLDVLKMRGLDLKDILKTIGCPDTWITEVPLPPSTKDVLMAGSAKELPLADQRAPPGSSSMPLPTSAHIENRNTLKKPFKSISGEIGFVNPLNLNESLELKSPVLTGGTSQASSQLSIAKGLGGLFDDWDPTANLDIPGTSSDIPTDTTLATDGLKVPKEEIIEEEDKMIAVDNTKTFEMNDTELANQQERNIIKELLRQQQGFGAEDREHSSQPVAIGKKKNGGEEPEALHYVIACNYPGCGLQYNWRVKYGKLRLLDHALTHSNRKIPCKLCGFECTNVRKMRSHYSKVHPNDRVEGYGMKALVTGDYGIKRPDGGEQDQQVSDAEITELWNACYSESLDLVGHATGFVDGDKYRRMTKRRKMERESLNSMNFMF